MLFDLPVFRGQRDAFQVIFIVQERDGQEGFGILLSSLQGLGGSAEVPGLVEHTQHVAAGQSSDVLVIVHNEGVGADEALVIDVIQLGVVGLCVILVNEGPGGEFRIIHVNQHFTVVGTAHEVLHGVDQAETAPVFAQDGESGVGGAVFSSGVLLDVAFEHCEVLVNGLRHNVVVPLDDFLLGEEGRSVVGLDVVIVQHAVVGDDVQFAILAQQLVQLHVGAVQVLVQVGGLLFADVGQQVDQHVSIFQDLSAVSAVEQVGLFVVSDLQRQGLVQVVGQELDFKADSEFVSDLLVDLVVSSGLIARISLEHGHGDGSVFRHHGRNDRENHRQSQQGSQDFPHSVSPPIISFWHLVPLHIFCQNVRTCTMAHSVIVDKSLLYY